jgi:hypothetical protein
MLGPLGRETPKWDHDMHAIYAYRSFWDHLLQSHYLPALIEKQKQQTLLQPPADPRLALQEHDDKVLKDFILDHGIHALLDKLAKQDCWDQLPLNMRCFTLMAKDDTDRCTKCMSKLQVLEGYASLLASAEKFQQAPKALGESSG